MCERDLRDASDVRVVKRVRGDTVVREVREM